MHCPIPDWLRYAVLPLFVCITLRAASASLDIQSAVDLAAGAPQPYKRRSGFEPPKGPSAYLTRVYRQDLDAESLRVRAVTAMLIADASKARDLFQQIPALNLPPLSCDDFTVYDVDDFYDLLGQVTAQAFSLKEIRQGDRAHFLARYIGGIHSAVEVTPAARLLATASIDDAEFQQVVTSFAGALIRISGDDRSFTEGARRAGPAILALVPLAQRRGISPLVILDAYRLFLVNNLSSLRCADAKTTEAVDSPVTFFNDRLALAPLQPLTDQEIAPAKVEGEAKGV